MNQAKNVCFHSITDATAYLKKNFSKDMYFGDGEIGAIVKKIWDDKGIPQNEHTILSSILPLTVKMCPLGDVTVQAGKCWNLSEVYKDTSVINLEIDTLTMETGSSISCTGKVLNLTINNLKRVDISSSTPAKHDIEILGNDGKNGNDGAQGSQGTRGNRGRDGEEASPGIVGPEPTPGESGNQGGIGGNGSNGNDGESIWATTITIKNMDKPITIYAKPGNGGNGGNGGKGGTGGAGGNGGNGIKSGCEGQNGAHGGNGGNGGKGGDGGNGGNGGNGGAIKVLVGESLAHYVNTLINVSDGGKGGNGGDGGDGGDKGCGGNGEKYHHAGPDGNYGAKGGSGNAGNDGKSGSIPTIEVSEMSF